MTPAARNATPLAGVGLAPVGFAAFSLHDALAKAVGAVPTFHIVFFAVLFSFVPFSVALAPARSERSFRPRLPGLVALRCVSATSGLLCAFHAFGNLPLAEVYALMFSAPILIALLAVPILGERVRAFRWFAIALGMAGVLFVWRELAASTRRPVLSTRNLRVAGGPQARPRETDPRGARAGSRPAAGPPANPSANPSASSSASSSEEPAREPVA